MIVKIIKVLLVSILCVFSVSHIQHLFQIRFSNEVFNEVGFPLKYQYESTFSNLGIHGFNLKNLILDIVIVSSFILLIDFVIIKIKGRVSL